MLKKQGYFCPVMGVPGMGGVLNIINCLPVTFMPLGLMPDYDAGFISG
jgi:hypothetical protein